nr:ABC transporter substrate-binding protein [Lichenihabitans psoromatis]
MALFNQRRLRFAVFGSLAYAIVGGASFPAAAATIYPLTIKNCGSTLTVDKAPQRVVSIGQSTTETLLALGLADKIVGTAVWFGPVLKAYEADNAKIKRLADNDPSFEAVVAQQPDFVAAQYEWHIGPNGSVGKREQFSDLKILAYVSPADCVEKDNTTGGDGVRKQLFTMQLVYQEIHELAAIFDISDRGDALIADLKKREAAAVATASGSNAKAVPIVFWFSSKDVKGDAFVAGKNGAPAFMMQALGVRNVITTEDEWPLASWESIVAADPRVIVIARMDRRRFPADALDVKLKFLGTDPVVSHLDAVRNKRFVVLDAMSMNPSMRTIDGLEALADGIKALGQPQ